MSLAYAGGGDIHVPRTQSDVQAVEEHGGTSVRSAVVVLAAWDRRVAANSRGAVLFAEWVAQLRRVPFRTTWQVDDPLNTPAGLADPRGAVAALERAAQKVVATHGALDVPWGEVHRLCFEAGIYRPAVGRVVGRCGLSAAQTAASRCAAAIRSWR